MMEEPRHTDAMLLSKGVKLFLKSFPMLTVPHSLHEEGTESLVIAIGEILEHGKVAIADMERLCPTIGR